MRPWRALNPYQFFLSPTDARWNSLQLKQDQINLIQAHRRLAQAYSMLILGKYVEYALVLLCWRSWNNTFPHEV